MSLYLLFIGLGSIFVTIVRGDFGRANLLGGGVISILLLLVLILLGVSNVGVFLPELLFDPLLLLLLLQLIEDIFEVFNDLISVLNFNTKFCKCSKSCQPTSS